MTKWYLCHRSGEKNKDRTDLLNLAIRRVLTLFSHWLVHEVPVVASRKSWFLWKPTPGGARTTSASHRAAPAAAAAGAAEHGPSARDVRRMRDAALSGRNVRCRAPLPLPR